MNVSVVQPPRSAWRTWTACTATVAVIAILAFLASPTGPLGGFWRPAPDMPAPTAGQLPFMILRNLIEVVTFGLGIAFALFGYRLLESARVPSRALTVAAYVCIVWLLASWWPHDSLHIANGMAMNGLIGIEYAFHVTCMVAGMIVALFFLAVIRQRVREGGGPATTG